MTPRYRLARGYCGVRCAAGGGAVVNSSPCYHDGKGVHVRMVRLSPVVAIFRRPHALTDSIWARCDFDDVFSPCVDHLTPHPVL